MRRSNNVTWRCWILLVLAASVLFGTGYRFSVLNAGQGIKPELSAESAPPDPAWMNPDGTVDVGKMPVWMQFGTERGRFWVRTAQLLDLNGPANAASEPMPRLPLYDVPNGKRLGNFDPNIQQVTLSG
jgi:hypothetical protein